MGKLFVLQSGQTTWEKDHRFEPQTGTPLTEEAVGEVRSAAGELASRGIDAVYAATGESERQTAKLVAKTLGVRMRTKKALRELDYGLWQGLTREELKRRQPKIFRKWNEDPSSIRPPEGETLEEAEERLRSALQEILRKHRKGAPLLVLRPVMVGLLRCAMQRRPLDELWGQMSLHCRWDAFETNGDLP